MTGVRVFIATTEGPSEIQRILPEDPEVRSVVCLNGTSTALPISGAYDAFVRKPTGVIARQFDHPVFRMDVSHPISSGHSWQLGAFLAHALLAENRLGNGHASEAVIATGTVNHGLEVGAVSHVDEKIERSRDLLQRLEKDGVAVTFVVPAANAKEEAVARLIAELEKPKIRRFVAAEAAAQVCDRLGSRLKGKAASRRTSVIVRDADDHAGGRSRRGLIAGTVMAAFVCGTAYAGWAVWDSGLREWLDFARQGRYRALIDGLNAAENGGCATCLVARHAFLVYANGLRPLPADTVITATEVRAPEGQTCTAIDFGRAKPLTPVFAMVGEAFPASAGDGLCALEYRVENKGKATAYAWLAAARTNGDDGDPEDLAIQQGAMAPGAALAVSIKVPRWPRGPMTNHVVVIVGQVPSDDIDSFLANLVKSDDRRAKRAVSRMEQLGLTAQAVRHSVIP